MDLDPPDNPPPAVKAVRVWKLEKSETSGRVTGTRRNHQHFHEGPSELSREEHPSTSDWEDVTVPASREPSEQPPAKPLKPSKPTTKRKRVRVVKENDSVSLSNISPRATLTLQQTRMAGWLANAPIVLDELLRKDGLGDVTLGLCANCGEPEGRYRCRDCLGGRIRCLQCSVSSHRELPLHRLQVCPGELPGSWLHYMNLHPRSGRMDFLSA